MGDELEGHSSHREIALADADGFNRFREELLGKLRSSYVPSSTT